MGESRDAASAPGKDETAPVAGGDLAVPAPVPVLLVMPEGALDPGTGIESALAIAETQESITLVSLPSAPDTARSRGNVPTAPEHLRSEAGDQTATLVAGLSREVTPPPTSVIARTAHRSRGEGSDLMSVLCGISFRSS